MINRDELGCTQARLTWQSSFRKADMLARKGDQDSTKDCMLTESQHKVKILKSTKGERAEVCVDLPDVYASHESAYRLFAHDGCATRVKHVI